ncbi:redox-sensitive transcriptional activator SoxR [Aeromicrobium sp.]|jgi:MerR family transcriptional regulator, redox-sensitive transcriptional activator SoxR|uniref:redox-sensitive transcriptional activator SoxR n=1 Tax=Aeromicrobium sp. TaxID=1871063 RepID=UPI0035160B6F
MDTTDRLTPQQVAERSGVAVSALHFYESRGLITATRTTGNQRRYGRDVLRRLAFVQFSQRLGIPLAEIGEALATLPDDRVPTKRDWTRLTSRWRADLDARIARLQALRDDLDGCIGCGCLSLRSCSVYNHDDELGRRGPGPHRGLT